MFYFSFLLLLSKNRQRCNLVQKLLRGLITLWSRVEDGAGERERMESSHVIDGVYQG